AGPNGRMGVDVYDASTGAARPVVSAGAPAAAPAGVPAPVPAGVPAVIDLRQRDAQLQAVRNLIDEAQRQQPDALADLAKILAKDPDPVIRQVATAGFAGVRTPEAVAALTTALGDQDPTVRSN